MQKILWPETAQPASVRVAVVAGRVRSCLGSLIADAEDRAVRDLRHRRPERRGAPLVGRGGRHLPEADDVEHEDEVHVDAERQGGVASCEPARRDEHVVHRRHAETTAIRGNRRREISAPPDHCEALEGKGRLAIVSRSAFADLLRECLGEGDEPCSGLRLGRQLEIHLRFLSIVGSRGRNEP